MHYAGRILAAVALLLGASVDAWAEDANLVTAPTLATSDAHQVPGWIFSMWNLKGNPGFNGKVDGTITKDADGREMLSVASTESIGTLQMWWQTTGKIACTGGGSYQLSVSVKGALRSGTARPTIALTFLDASGKWIGAQEITQDPTIPGDWQTVTGKVIAPENAATVGVRIGLVFSEGDATISYKNVVLTPAAP